MHSHTHSLPLLKISSFLMHPSSSTWALLPKHTQLTFGTSSVKNKRPRCKIIYHSLVGQALRYPNNTERGRRWHVVMQILALYFISILPHTLTHILSDINLTHTHWRVIASVRHTHNDQNASLQWRQATSCSVSGSCPWCWDPTKASKPGWTSLRVWGGGAVCTSFN